MDLHALAQCFVSLHATLATVALRISPVSVPHEMPADERTLAYALSAGRGIALLRLYGPSNWYNRIDLEKLDMSEARSCVLGQVYGYFNDGMVELGLQGEYIPNDIADQSAIHAGFDVDTDQSADNLDLAYAELTAAWVDALTSMHIRDEILTG